MTPIGKQNRQIHTTRHVFLTWTAIFFRVSRNLSAADPASLEWMVLLFLQHGKVTAAAEPKKLQMSLHALPFDVSPVRTMHRYVAPYGQSTRIAKTAMIESIMAKGALTM